jgi:hypothetical protein
MCNLMAGRWEQYSYDSQSEADLALCVLLARKHDSDASKIDAEFRKSGLYREKWDRRNYSEPTIAEAIRVVGEGSPTASTRHVTASVIEPEVREEAIPVFPLEALEGDCLTDLARILTDGTQIPPQFVLSNIKTILGAAITGRVGFPGHEDLHTRQYNLNISLRERTGKGESWKRTAKEGAGLLNSLLEEAGIKIVNGGVFGSGQYLVKALADGAAGAPEYHPLVRFDEMREFFQRDDIRASTLETKFLELYEETTTAQGSFSNNRHEVKGVHLSFSGDFTRDGFYAAFVGRGSRGSGFLARCTLSFGDKATHVGDGRQFNMCKAVAAVARIRERLEDLPQRATGGKGRFIPQEDESAYEHRLEFFKWLDEQDRKFTGEMMAHFKRDLLLRAVFSASQRITSDKTDRTIAWAQHQLDLRRLLWPGDAGSPVERMERRIVEVLRRHGPLSDRQLVQYCNVNREGSGGREAYRRALNALAYGSREVCQVAKTARGSPIWGPTET